MATRFIDKEYGATTTTAIANDATGTAKVRNLPDAAGFVYDNVDGTIKYNDAGTIRGLARGFNAGIVSATASTLTITASLHAGRTIVLNLVGGIAIQLPTATGSGNKYHFVVGTASDANVLSAVVATDDFYGGYIQNDTGDTVASSADFMEAASTSNTYSPTTLGGGGLIGDWFEVIDIATAVWQFKGMNKGVVDPTNRFSAV